MHSIINEFLGHISLLAKALSTPHFLRSQHQQVVRLSDRLTRQFSKTKYSRDRENVK